VCDSRTAPGAGFDPRNDPPDGNATDPSRDYGRQPGRLWHRLVAIYGSQAEALCGARIYGTIQSVRARPVAAVCADCDRFGWAHWRQAAGRAPDVHPDYDAPDIEPDYDAPDIEPDYDAPEPMP
jgi:hypothetical protein